jgi:3'(2'), 5'-bisphosphate nucleotidase
MDIQPLLDLARRAGDAILAVRSSGAFATRAKDDRSPLTAADLAADTIIGEGLARLDPATPVLSEEGAQPAAGTAWPRFWCVDPLDGTKEFLSGSGEFTVNIALVEDGRPVLGVVHAPALPGAPLWWGGPALGGSWVRRGCVTVAIRCQPLPAPPAALRIVASKSHRDAATDAWIAALGRAVEVVSAGSSLKFCLVAEGAADLYPRLGPTCAWDTAAAHAVVLGAGGTVCDLAGRELRYDPASTLNPSFVTQTS